MNRSNVLHELYKQTVIISYFSDQNDTKQFELPFIYSVSIWLKREGCPFCDAGDNHDDADRCRFIFIELNTPSSDCMCNL